MILKVTILVIYFLVVFKSLSKYRFRLLDIVLFVAAALLYSFRNMYEQDTIIYNYVYAQLKTTAGYFLGTNYGIDIGFLFLMRCFSRLGIPFEYFRLVVFTAGMLLIFHTVKKIVGNWPLVFCLYLYFPFGYDSYQIRNFLSYAVVVYAIGFLLEDHKKPMRYVVCIIIAGLIHKVSLAYLLYLLILLPTKNYMKHMMRGVGALCVLFVLLGGDLISIVGRVISDEKLVRYGFQSMDYRMNVYLQIFETVMFITFLVLNNRILERKPDKSELDENLSIILNLSIAFVPFVLISLTFERVLRPFILLTYTNAVVCHEQRLSKNRWLPLLIVSVLIIVRMTVSFSCISNMFNDCSLIMK